jgi:hypothetical protein
MTTVAATNTGGFDYGKALDSILGVYQSVSTARVQRDVAKYNMAGATQLATLHNPQAANMLEAYGIANPNPNGVGSVAVNGANNSGGINAQTLMIGGVAIVGSLLLWRALK